MANPKRFNVVTTRAKSLMVIVGDPSILMHDPHWLALLHYVRDNNGCVGSPMPQLPSQPLHPHPAAAALQQRQNLQNVWDYTACRGLPMQELPPRQQQQPQQVVAGLSLPSESPRGYGMEASGPLGSKQASTATTEARGRYDDKDHDSPAVRGMHLLSLLQAPGQQRPYSVASAMEGVAMRRHDA